MSSLQAISLISLAIALGCSKSGSPDVAPADEVKPPTNSSMSEPGQRSIVKLTEAAASKLKEFLAAESAKHVRLSVKNDGPTGFRYSLKIDDAVDESDFVDTTHGFTLAVDRASSLLLEGTTIDWQTQPDGQAGFKFDNPNAVQP
jgi:iron-sulfur cluster assembly accessory protein